MDSLESPWQTAFRLLLKPRLLLQGVVEYGSAWLATRRWGGLVLLYFPIFLLCAASVGLVTYGAWQSTSTLVERYSEWVSEEMPLALTKLDDDQPSETPDKIGAEAGKSGEQADAPESASPKANAEDEQQDRTSDEQDEDEDEDAVSADGELLLRRLLQLEDANSRATYLVAAQLGQRGRVGQARQMMRRIAPEGGGGFSPAHAWLAAESLSRTPTFATKAEQTQFLDRLTADMDTARQWRGTPTGLLLTYAQILEQRNEIADAFKIYEQVGQTDRRGQILLAEKAQRLGYTQQLDRTSKALKEDIRKKIENGQATAAEFGDLASIFLIEQDIPRARQVLQMGFDKDAEDARLKRLLSESYRIEFMATITTSGENASVNLGLLDAALKADPTNPSVGTAVAMLIASGQDASPELKSALEQQLANGKATAVTHILLANSQLQSGQLSGAVPHLEIALRQAPGNAMVMNNLALALARTDEAALQRALQLSQAAVQAAPQNAEYVDSLGEIRQALGDNFGAIEAFEAAIGIDNSRSSTRLRLAEIYEQLGMQDMARIQRSEVEKLQSATDSQEIESPKEDSAAEPTEAPASSIEQTQ